MHPDLERSFKQFSRHESLGHLNLNLLHKFFLSLVFFLLLPFSFLNILFIYKQNKKRDIIHVLKYKGKEPFITIYKKLEEEDFFTFIEEESLVIPVLPWIWIKDIWNILKKDPIFFITNLYFFGALSLKIGQYYGMLKKNNILNLIVFQEYSFYMTYFTRVVEYDGGSLYNIQHGIPGETYCYFRFTKSFVWGEHYRQLCIDNFAEPSQFVVSGSIFHSSLKKKNTISEEIDILYVMQGYVGSRTDTLVILDVLKELSSLYNIRILQHPRHKIKIDTTFLELDESISVAISKSKLIVSRYSTALLDALYLGKRACAYIGEHDNLYKFVDYLEDSDIIREKEKLSQVIINSLNTERIYCLDEKYIDNTKNPIHIIMEELKKSKKGV